MGYYLVFVGNEEDSYSPDEIFPQSSFNFNIERVPPELFGMT